MPVTESVTIVNLSPTLDLYLFAVQTDSIHFHSASQRKVIPPGGNSTFSVVFLPREIGPVESSVILKTSVGGIIYTVRSSYADMI